MRSPAPGLGETDALAQPTADLRDVVRLLAWIRATGTPHGWIAAQIWPIAWEDLTPLRCQRLTAKAIGVATVRLVNFTGVEQ